VTTTLIRTVGPNGESYNGFVWPLTVGAVVECSDWDPDPQRACGGGLHAIEPMHGDWSLLSWEPKFRPLLVEVDDADVAYRGTEKLRFRRATVCEVGEPGSLYAMLCRLTCDATRINALVSEIAAQGKEGETVASGNGSQLAASGNGSQLAASGYGSQLAASGDDSQLAASEDCSQLAA
jgi:hypothetical protein